MATSSEPAVERQGASYRNFGRLAGYCLVASGVCFTAFPAIRPFFEESLVKNAGTYALPIWWIAHAFGMAGFVLLAFGLLGFYLAMTRTRAEPLLWWALQLDWIGTGLTLPFFGAEAFSLPIIGREAAAQNSHDLLALVDEVRFGPAIFFVLVGLILIAVAAILLARAVWVSGRLSKWSGVPVAVGMVAFLPILQGAQIFQSLRIIDGLVVTAGGAWMLRELLTKDRA